MTTTTIVLTHAAAVLFGGLVVAAASALRKAVEADRAGRNLCVQPPSAPPGRTPVNEDTPPPAPRPTVRRTMWD